MKIILSILIVISYLFSGTSSLKDEAELFLKNFFANNAELRFVKFSVPPELKSKIEKSVGQRFYKEFVYLWKVYEGSELKSVAILDNVYGKSLPITFIVIFDIEGTIKTVEILKYREPYGGQVTERGWLKQFTNKNSGSNFEIGKEINTISGATISSNSVTKGIKKLTLLYEEIKNSL